MEKGLPICQKCKMPLQKEGDFWTNSDGSLNSDYCIYCFKDGEFVEFCQSCGMPLQKEEDLWTNVDGSLNQEYCVYCFKDGAYMQDCSMEEMIQHNIQYLSEFSKENDQQFSSEEAVESMREFFPTLKRWKK